MKDQMQAGGRFRKGQSGNPAGRKKGVPNKVSRKVIERLAEHGDELLDVVLSKAAEGDMTALKLCLERLCPAMKEFPLPAVNLPDIEGPEDLPKATGALLQAASSGALTPSALAALSTALKVHVDAIQTADLAKRVQALEEGDLRDEN